MCFCVCYFFRCFFWWFAVGIGLFTDFFFFFFFPYNFFCIFVSFSNQLSSVFLDAYFSFTYNSLRVCVCVCLTNFTLSIFDFVYKFFFVSSSCRRVTLLYTFFLVYMGSITLNPQNEIDWATCICCCSIYFALLFIWLTVFHSFFFLSLVFSALKRASSAPVFHFTSKYTLERKLFLSFCSTWSLFTVDNNFSSILLWFITWIFLFSTHFPSFTPYKFTSCVVLFLSFFSSGMCINT